MKPIVITPGTYDDDLGVDNDMRMLLYQEVVRHDSKFSLGDMGYYKILDNGAYENAKPEHTSDLLKVARRMQVDELVIPDVLNDYPQTKWEFDRFVVDYVNYTGWDNVREPRLMVVPQGNTISDFMYCAQYLFKQFSRLNEEYPHCFPAPPIVGMPKVSSRFLAGRHNLIKHINREYMTYWEPKEPFIHLLGWNGDYKEIIACAKMPMVRSIDTARPIVLAINGISMRQDLRFFLGNPIKTIQRLPIQYVKRPENYFDLVLDATSATYSLCIENRNTFEDLCSGDHYEG